MGWQEDLAGLVGDITGTGQDWTTQAEALGGPLTDLSDTVASVVKPPPYLTQGGSRLAKTLAARKPLQDLLLPSTDPAVTSLPPAPDSIDLLGRIIR